MGGVQQGPMPRNMITFATAKYPIELEPRISVFHSLTEISASFHLLIPNQMLRRTLVE